MRLLFSVFILILHCFIIRADENNTPSFEEICILNKKQIDLIQTLHCRVESGNILNSPNGKTRSSKREGEFWYIPGQVKARIIDANFNQEYTWKDSILKQFSTTTEPGSDTPLYSVIHSNSNTRYIHNLDPFLVGLMVINPPETVNGALLSQILNQSVIAKKKENKTEDNAKYIVLTLEFKPNNEQTIKSDWNLELYFDKSVNFLVKKAIYTQIKTNFRRIIEVTSFKSYDNGIFFPESVVNRSFDGEKLTKLTVAKFTNVVINEKIPEEIFQIRYPHGILLVDNIKKTNYPINENGEPIEKNIPNNQDGQLLFKIQLILSLIPLSIGIFFIAYNFLILSINWQKSKKSSYVLLLGSLNMFVGLLLFPSTTARFFCLTPFFIDPGCWELWSYIIGKKNRN